MVDQFNANPSDIGTGALDVGLTTSEIATSMIAPLFGMAAVGFIALLMLL